jgi:hypothetical protein
MDRGVLGETLILLNCRSTHESERVWTTPDQLILAIQADGGSEAHRKATRRDVLLAEMDKVVPWSELCAVIEPFYPKARPGGGALPGGSGAPIR